VIVLAKRKGRWVMRTTVEAHSPYGRSPAADARVTYSEIDTALKRMRDRRKIEIRTRLAYLDALIERFGWNRRKKAAS
jgi:hypothetical protein